MQNIHSKTNYLKLLFLLLTPVPAIVLGAFVMHFHGVPITIWIQNIVYLLTGWLVCLGLLVKKGVRDHFVRIWLYLAFIILLIPFANSGIDGVHRWINIGPVKLHISSILLPFLLISLWKLARNNYWWLASITAVGISITLSLQPDAAQTTAFTLAILVVLGSMAKEHFLRWSFLMLMLPIMIIPWIFLDSLAPVPHVEDILTLANNLGSSWFISGFISLAILPSPFLFFSPQKYRSLSIGLAVYFIATLLTPLFGHFPVPLMGYGISPILGYFIALIWFIKSHTLQYSISI